MDNGEILVWMITAFLSIMAIGFGILWHLWEKAEKTHHRILTCPQGVISFTYETPTPLKWHYALDHMNFVSQKIRDILETNPQADLKAFETELKITFTNIQLKPQPDPIITEQPRTAEIRRRPGFLGSDDK